jgi:tetratricopeptide (TPR) repeat protein
MVSETRRAGKQAFIPNVYADVFDVFFSSDRSRPDSHVHCRPMTTLYDLLGVHPDADDETLKWAFRRAFATTPCGPNGADPLFRSMVARGVLWDAKQRAVCEQLLTQERERLQTKAKRVVIASTLAVCVAILAAVSAVRFALVEPGTMVSVVADKTDHGVSTAPPGAGGDAMNVEADTPPAAVGNETGPAAAAKEAAVTAPASVPVKKSDSGAALVAATKVKQDVDAPPVAMAPGSANGDMAPAVGSGPSDTGATSAVAGKERAVPPSDDVASGNDANLPAPAARQEVDPLPIAAPAVGKDRDTASAAAESKGERDTRQAAADASELAAAMARSGVDASSAATTARKGGGTSITAATVDRTEETATALAVPKKDDGPSTQAGGPLGGKAEMAPAQPTMENAPKAQEGLGDGPRSADASGAAADQAGATIAPGGLDWLFMGSSFRNEARFYRERGIISYKRGAFQQALSDLDEAIRLDRDDAQAHNIRGNILDELGAFDRALADYEEAIRLEPNNSAVFHDRAILWHRRGDLSNALTDLDQAIRYNVSDAKIYCDRGLIWYKKGNNDRAVADFNQAVKLDAGFTATCIRRGVILHRNSEFNLAFAAGYPPIRVDPRIFDPNRRATKRSSTRPEPRAVQTAPSPAESPNDLPSSLSRWQGPLSNR